VGAAGGVWSMVVVGAAVVGATVVVTDMADAAEVVDPVVVVGDDDGCVVGDALAAPTVDVVWTAGVALVPELPELHAAASKARTVISTIHRSRPCVEDIPANVTPGPNGGRVG